MSTGYEIVPVGTEDIAAGDFLPAVVFSYTAPSGKRVLYGVYTVSFDSYSAPSGYSSPTGAPVGDGSSWQFTVYPPQTSWGTGHYAFFLVVIDE